MKRYNSIPILGILLLLCARPLPAKAATTTHVWSLEEIWQFADTNNRQLKLSELNLRQSHLEVLEAKDRLLPELSIGADAKLNTRFLIYDNGLFSAPQDVPIKGYGYAAGYNFNVNLYNGGKDRGNIRIKQEEEIRRQYEIDQQKHSVKYNVAVAYFDLYKYLRFRDFLTAEIAAENKQLSLIESLYKNGTVLRSDVLRVSVKLSQLTLSISDIEKKIDLTIQRLNILMGRDGEAALAIDYQSGLKTGAITDSSYADYVAIALHQSPAYKMAHSDIKWSALQIRQSRLPGYLKFRCTPITIILIRKSPFILIRTTYGALGKQASSCNFR